MHLFVISVLSLISVLSKVSNSEETVSVVLLCSHPKADGTRPKFSAQVSGTRNWSPETWRLQFRRFTSWVKTPQVQY